LREKVFGGNGECAGVIEAIKNKERSKEAIEIIDSVIPGSFVRGDFGDLLFHEAGAKKPLRLRNVSGGVKIFLLIKRLLEVSAIDEKSVLIFDEPETRLRPDLQLKLAETLVLLQKGFGLKVLLTTHSEYLTGAIETYSEKYGTGKSFKQYLVEGNGAVSETAAIGAEVSDIAAIWCGLEQIGKEVADLASAIKGIKR
jgi:hypothetical protein